MSHRSDYEEARMAWLREGHELAKQGLCQTIISPEQTRRERLFFDILDQLDRITGK